MHEFNSYEDEGLRDSHFQYKNKNDTEKLPYPKRYKAVKVTGWVNNYQDLIEKVKVYCIDYPNEDLALGSLGEFKVNGKTYTDIITLIEDLNKIVFKKGGGGVSEQNLQNVTEKGNTTDQDIITNEAVIGRDKVNNTIKFGKDALKSNNAGKQNIAIGDFSLSENEESSFNIAIGFKNLQKLKKGEDNVSIGDEGCKETQESNKSVIIGVGAAQNAPKLTSDTFIGAYAGHSWKAGIYQMLSNPDITHESGKNVAVGELALAYTYRGVGNTVIGAKCGTGFRNYGDYNTLLGYGITEGSNYAADCSVFIGSNCPTRYKTIEGKDVMKESYSFAVHAQPHRNEGGDVGIDPLISGNFKDRWFTVSGTWKLHPKYVLDADKDNTFTPVKMLVADDKGNVGIKQIVDKNVRTCLDFNNTCCVEVDFLVDQPNRLDISFLTQAKDFKDFSLCVFSSSSQTDFDTSFSTINKIGSVIVDINDKKNTMRVYLPPLGIGEAAIKVSAESKTKNLTPEVKLMNREEGWGKYSKTINVTNGG